MSSQMKHILEHILITVAMIGVIGFVWTIVIVVQHLKLEHILITVAMIGVIGFVWTIVVVVQHLKNNGGKI